VEVFLAGRAKPIVLREVHTTREPAFPWALLLSTDVDTQDAHPSDRLIFVQENRIERVEVGFRPRPKGAAPIGFAHVVIDSGVVSGESLRFRLRGRDYLVPVAEVEELVAELDTLAADDSLDEPLKLAAVSTRTLVDTALRSQTPLEAVDFHEDEDRALELAIANMIGRGTAGPELERLRDDLIRPTD
jgi:hypothetical protein